MSRSSAFPAERIVRLAFGVVVVLFFGGLSLVLVFLRATHDRLAGGALADVALIVGILLFALIAAYGLDQLLTGIRPSRRRWFSGIEERLEDH